MSTDNDPQDENEDESERRLAQAELLHATFIRFRDEFGVSVSHRDLAAHMRPGASAKEIDSLKSQISKWRTGHGGISEPNALALADAFNKIRPDSVPRDYFTKERGQPQTWSERMRAIATASAGPQQEAYQAEMRRLREELSQLREEGEKRHGEVLDEIRRLRDAS